MEPTQPPQPEITPTPEPQEEGHRARTYQDDMANAMNATEATEVQEMLARAREQAAEVEIEGIEKREKVWYSWSSLIIIILTLGVLGYGTYYYMHLTVPVTPPVSVGVFQSTSNIIADNTTIQDVLNTYSTPDVVAPHKPVLVNLINDDQTNTLISNNQLYSFIGAAVPEPMQAVISSARLGIANTGTKILPFIVASVPDPEKASNEFSIAEPTLLEMFSKALNINIQALPQQPAPAFQSQYFYNLPVRTLTETDSATGEQKIVFLYGYATNNIIVIASDPTVLKEVYDTVIAQY